MAVQHFLMNVIDDGTGTDAFFVIMLQNHQVPFADTSVSLGTSAHETGEFCTVTNLYATFARLGMVLHGCQIRILSHPNKHGATVTGVFNISGTGYTMGAQSLPELVERVHQKWLEKQAWYRKRREEKRVQYLLRWIERHPDQTVLPWYFEY